MFRLLGVIILIRERLPKKHLWKNYVGILNHYDVIDWSWRTKPKKSLKKTLLETNSSPFKKGQAPKGNLIFQPLVFRGYVNCREGGAWKTIDKKWLDGNICSGKLAFIFLVGEGGRGVQILTAIKLQRRAHDDKKKDLSKTEEPCTINNHTLLMLQKSDQALFWDVCQ